MSLFGKGAGLSINTDRNLLNSTNTSQAQPPVAPGFGSAAASASGGGGGGVGGGGLFGSSTAAATQSQPPQQPQQQTSGLFGGGQPSNSQQFGGAGGSMFGNTAGTAPTGSGGLFGGLGGGGGNSGNNNTTSQAQPAPSLFGNTSNLQGGGGQQEAKPAGGLFGGLGGANNNNASAPSLFGAQQQKPSLFGAGATAANAPTAGQQPSLFGLSGLNQSSAQPTQPAQQPGGLGSSFLGQRSTQQATVPGVKIDVSQMRGTTRFNDLHEELQRKIEQADSFIQQQISYAGQCSALLPTHEQDLSYIPNDVDYVAHKLDTTELTIGNDSVAIAKLKDLVAEDTADAQLSFKAIDNLKLPQHFHYSGLRSTRSAVDSATMDAADDVPTSADLISYFGKRTSAFAQTAAEYDRNVREIEIHLRTVEAAAIAQTEAIMARSAVSNNASSRNGAAVGRYDGRNGGVSAGQDDELRNLAAVLADFERGILSVASKVGAVREGVVELVVGSEDSLGNSAASTSYGYNRRKGASVR